MPVLRSSVAHLRTMFELAHFNASRETGEETEAAVACLVAQLPDIPEAPDATRMILRLDQQGINTLHGLAEYACYVATVEEHHAELADSAGKMRRSLPPPREINVLSPDDLTMDAFRPPGAA